MDLIKDLWRGDVPLVKTFWIFGFGPPLCAAIILRYLLFDQKIIATIPGTYLLWFLILFHYIYNPFILTAIWASANKYQGLRWYAIAAKIAVILGWVGYLRSFVVAFR